MIYIGPRGYKINMIYIYWTYESQEKHDIYWTDESQVKHDIYWTDESQDKHHIYWTNESQVKHDIVGPIYIMFLL
jgi:hypothetical protein